MAAFANLCRVFGSVIRSVFRKTGGATTPASNAKRVHRAQLLLGVICTLALPQVAQTAPERGGFTLSLSAGAGAFASFQVDGDNVVEPAIAPLSIGLGGFISPRVAVLMRASMTMFRYSPQGRGVAESRLETTLTRSLFLGVSAQRWLSDSWTVETGLGFSFIGNGPIEAQINRGIGLSARLSRSLAPFANGSISAVWDLSPAFFSRRETTVSSTVGLMWQLP